MATSVIASSLYKMHDSNITFSFHSYNQYGNACYSFKVIIVVTIMLGTIQAIPDYG